MILSLLVAADQKGGIGYQNDLPWHLSADLKRFKRITLGHHLLMGRKTYQSIGQPLPGRTMIVLSRSPDFHPDGCLMAGSTAEALDLAQERGEKELFVIGGSSIFQDLLPRTDHLYLTRVHAEVKADVFLPPIDLDEWVLICEQFQDADQQNQYPHTFQHYRRKTISG